MSENISKSQYEEFACSDGSNGIVVDGQLIYRAECSGRAWSSNAPKNVWSRLKLLVGKMSLFRKKCRIAKPYNPTVYGSKRRRV